MEWFARQTKREMPILAMILCTLFLSQVVLLVKGSDDWINDDAKMDVRSMIGQMAQIDIKLLLSTESEPAQLDQELLDKYIGQKGVGSVLNNHYLWKAADYRREVIRIQETARKFNRPPVIWGLDSVHGANYVLDAIVTPQPINLAASFNRTLAFEAGKLASRDTRRAGIPWLFSPLLGLSWNPSWSRVFETFGEDPLVVGSMAVSMIGGIQNYDQSGLLPSKAAASAKHFVGYSNPHNGHDRAPSVIPMRHLYQYFLLPWRDALLHGEDSVIPMTVMESYTEIDGVPNVANRRTLDRMLRKELNYTDGMVVTDYNEISNLERWHHTAGDLKEAVRSAMVDGTVDMSMMGNIDDVDAFFDIMEELLSTEWDQRVRTLKDRVQKSARRVLNLKRDLNMHKESFDLKPLPETMSYPTPQDFKSVLDMTRQSIVMTKNDNSALPLIHRSRQSSGGAPLKILVTGPTSDSLSFQTGGWTGEWQGVDSNKEREWFASEEYKTVTNALKDETQLFEVQHECGVDIMGNDCSDGNEENVDEEQNKQNVFDSVRGWFHGGNKNNNDRTSGSSSTGPPAAIVVCLGEENYAEKPGDISDLRLPQGQYDLVTALKEASSTNTKIILVYFGGRPRLLADVVPLVDAVIVGFLPGPLAGNAIADFFTGRVSPSARLPLTYPKHQDLSGIPYLHEISDMCTRDTGGTLPHWDNAPCEVQWPFGHGLSFTRFDYSDLRLNTQTLQQHWHDGETHRNWYDYDDEELTVTVTVTNTGDVAGAETVLFFIFDEFRSTTPEYKRLRGFEKVWLEPGESKEIQTLIEMQNDLRFVGPHDDSHYILQDGLSFRVGIGSESECRNDPDAQEYVCSDVVTIRTEENYIGACEAACNLWGEAGDQCVQNAFLPNARTKGAAMTSCRKTCADTNFIEVEEVKLNNDGWGWNYVECLESIVRNERFDANADCWKLTSLCRDVTHTAGIDEFGNTYNGNGSNPSSDVPPSIIVTAMISAAFAATMITLAVKGKFQTKVAEHPQNTIQNKDYGDVEFSAIQSSGENNSEIS